MKHKTTAMLLANLVTGAHSYTDLIKMSGMSQDTMAVWIAALRAKRLVFVESWGYCERNYPTVARFRWGPETPDAYKPVQTPAQRIDTFRNKNV